MNNLIFNEEDIVCNNRRESGLTRGQYELYKHFLHLKSNGLQFKKDELLKIYKKWVRKRVPSKHEKPIDSNMLYNSASVWLNLAISTLVRKGWLGLTFEKDITGVLPPQKVKRILK